MTSLTNCRRSHGRKGKALALPALLLLSAGCGQDAFELLAEQAVDSQDIGRTEGSLTAMSTDSVEDGAAPEGAAEQSAVGIKARLGDPSCHTATRTGSTVVHTFNACTGRYGLVRVTGTLTVVFSGTPANLRFTATGTGIEVNRAVVDVNSSGTLVRAGTARTLTVSTQGAGTGPYGNRIERQGNYVATYDVASECGTLNGEWSLSTGVRDRTTRVAGLAKCREQCPTAGTITHQGAAGRQVTVTFDGASSARWSSNRGHSGTVELRCTPATRS